MTVTKRVIGNLIVMKMITMIILIMAMKIIMKMINMIMITTNLILHHRISLFSKDYSVS